METLSRQKFADLLNGREFGNEITRDEASIAKASGLVVIYGASDDLVEFRGAMDEEIGGYEKIVFHLFKSSIVEAEQNMCNDSYCPYFESMIFKKQSNAAKFTARWCGDKGYEWHFETDVPHSTFEVFENGEKVCLGIVVSVADLPESV